ncbi:hypothetical protein E4T42_00368 [Aureobasidium subglaciale]|nr:hypothetical protein E4T42_00368 [Aureobasidium subglaciale]
MSTQNLRLPLVTEDDLHHFHQKHFSGSSSGSSNRSHDAGASFEENTTDDDDLGYYHDGVKRTLTDDQIAMFRHSEIQTLLRERRRRRENTESESNHDTPSGSTKTVGCLDVNTVGDGDRQRSASTSESQGLGKRKWQRFIESSETNPEHLTHRRIARELDEQKASSIDLMYGDEESTNAAAPRYSKTNPSTQDHGKQAQRDNIDEPSSVQTPLEEPRKSKFLWPILEAEAKARG